jgi:hypothetical protein
MYLKGLLGIFLVLTLMRIAVADENKPSDKDPAKATETKEEAKPGDAKRLSGISIVGNDEAPKSLYIVPWKGSEIGEATSMGMMLNESATPVDRDVFKRQLDYYEVSNKK